MKRTPLAHSCLTLIVILLLAWTAAAHAAEVIPPRPARYFNDYTGTITPPTSDQINGQLEQFERDTSNQLVVAIFPTMQSDSDVADYCTRVFRAWKVGQKDKNNGVVLFVFKNDRKMQIITGYGLEGALPDITCKQIIDNEIKPYFRKDQYAQGIQAGVNAIIAATKGEYKGTGGTADGKNVGGTSWIVIAFLVIIVLVWLLRSTTRFGGLLFSTMGSSYSGGWGSSGGGSWGGGGGFSGGGGSSGGGGAGGSW